ncbi:MAG: 3-oxoacyl-ACP synthase [Desulfobacteraceae bacterium]|nr:3-oxoacyl-ACP synthase [Desulfobacteraceae bacterium]
MIVTAVNNITAIGHDAIMTAASVRAGLVRFVKSGDYDDTKTNPIIVSVIKGIDEDNYNRKEKMGNIADYCLKHMLDEHPVEQKRPIHLLMGFAAPERPGLKYEDDNQELVKKLQATIQKKAETQIITQGNTSIIECIDVADKIIKENPLAICIIGAVDSLLDEDTLDWFEKDERLLSDSLHRQHSFVAGEAVGFMILESKQKAQSEKYMAEITGIGLADEPACFVSDKPCTGEALTNTFKAAISEKTDIGTVICDLNGEFFRAKEWSYANLRYFKDKNQIVIQPADSIGNIGAASGVVFAGIAVQGFSRGWIENDVLIFCADDHGKRGAFVLSKPL